MEELTDGLMDALMKGHGLKVECMGEDIWVLLMEEIMKVNSEMIKNKDLVN